MSALTLDFLQVNDGVRIRPVVYADYRKLHHNMNEHQISQYNRQLLPEGTSFKLDENDLYELLYNNPSDKLTQIARQIPWKKVKG